MSLSKQQKKALIRHLNKPSVQQKLAERNDNELLNEMEQKRNKRLRILFLCTISILSATIALLHYGSN